jgi:hypothetical protein
MTIDLALLTPDALPVLLPDSAGDLAPPRIITEAAPQANKCFLEFFTVTIRNKNTRRAYARAALQFFTWCEGRGIADLAYIEPMTVAAYIETRGARPRPSSSSSPRCACWLPGRRSGDPYRSRLQRPRPEIQLQTVQDAGAVARGCAGASG